MNALVSPETFCIYRRYMADEARNLKQYKELPENSKFGADASKQQ